MRRQRFRAAVLENKGASFASDWIVIQRARISGIQKIQRQTKPVVFRTIGFKQIDPILAAESQSRHERNGSKRRRNDIAIARVPSSARLEQNLAVWIAD
jgi:hypothetical protein